MNTDAYRYQNKKTFCPRFPVQQIGTKKFDKRRVTNNPVIILYIIKCNFKLQGFYSVPLYTAKNTGICEFRLNLCDWNGCADRLHAGYVFFSITCNNLVSAIVEITIIPREFICIFTEYVPVPYITNTGTC